MCCFLVISVSFLEENEKSMYWICVLQDDVPEVQEFFLVNLTSVELIMNHSTSSPPRLGKTTYTELSLVYFYMNCMQILLLWHMIIIPLTCPLCQWYRIFWKKHGRISNFFHYSLASYFFELWKNYEAIFIEELVINSWREQFSEKFYWHCVNLIFISKHIMETKM